MKSKLIMLAIMLLVLLVALLGYTAETGHLVSSLSQEPSIAEDSSPMALFEAIVQGDMDQVKKGLNMSNEEPIRDCDGNTPLHVAVASGRREVVDWIVKQYPNWINVPNHVGMTPRQMAKQEHRDDLLRAMGY